jgi:hypothetical protein
LKDGYVVPDDCVVIWACDNSLRLIIRNAKRNHPRQLQRINNLRRPINPLIRIAIAILINYTLLIGILICNAIRHRVNSNPSVLLFL